MAIVTYELKEGAKPTPAQLKELEALDNRPIVIDEDCPEFTDEQWKEFTRIMKKYNTRRITKEMLMAERSLSTIDKV